MKLCNCETHFADLPLPASPMTDLREALSSLELFDEVLDRWYLGEVAQERLVAAAVTLDESLHLIADTLRAVCEGEGTQ